MKIAPVSGDLLVKVALGAAALAALYWLAQRTTAGITGAAKDAAAWAENIAATRLNPASDQNIIYAPITAAIGAATGQDNSLGTAWRQVTSNDDARVQAMLDGQPVPDQQSYWSQFNDAALLAQ